MARFCISVCAASVIFSLVSVLIPQDRRTGAFKLAAAAFMLIVLLSSTKQLVNGIDFTMPAAEKKDTGLTVTDEYVEINASNALRTVISDMLSTRGCRYESVDVSVTYSDKGFTGLTVYVTAEDDVSKLKALALGNELKTDFIVTVDRKGGAENENNDR